jgi:hypothetical protein
MLITTAEIIAIHALRFLVSVIFLPISITIRYQIQQALYS